MAGIWAAPFGLSKLGSSTQYLTNCLFVMLFFLFVFLMHAGDSMNLKCVAMCVHVMQVVPVFGGILFCFFKIDWHPLSEQSQVKLFSHHLCWQVSSSLLPTGQAVSEQEKISDGSWRCIQTQNWDLLLNGCRLAPTGCLVLVSTATHFTSEREASVFPPLLYLKEVPK